MFYSILFYSLGAICVGYLVIAKIRTILAELPIRRTIKQLSCKFPNGQYRGFSLTDPYFYCEIDDYEVKCGATILSDRGDLDVRLFEKVKLKRPPHVPWPGKDSLMLEISNKELFLKFGWLTEYHSIDHKRPLEVVERTNILFNDTVLDDIKKLIEIARLIDSGCLDITSNIFKENAFLRREYIIGIFVSIVAFVFYWFIWDYYMMLFE